jgi:hypothetical protein
MTVFNDTQHMYNVLGKLFQTLMADPEMGERFRQSHIVIKFTISEPTGQIWLNSDGAVICGNAGLVPTIEMTLSGDACHQFWLKELTLPLALAKGKIKAKGPMPKVLKLLPMLKPAYEAYPEIAREYGLPIQS